MGLDVLILTDNLEEIHTDDFLENSDLYSLSRTFCNFLCRPNVSTVEPELDQIGIITGVDISPLYEMETYLSGDALDFYVSVAENEEERNAVIANAEAAKEKLKGNIDRVLVIINQLINKLSVINNLPELLDNGGNDTLNSKVYFADFNIDKGKGYIGNNFGQDLRNFRRFLEYAKSKGTQTVYFNYG